MTEKKHAKNSGTTDLEINTYGTIVNCVDVRLESKNKIESV